MNIKEYTGRIISFSYSSQYFISSLDYHISSLLKLIYLLLEFMKDFLINTYTSYIIAFKLYV